ncbi:type I restriction enzyme S subunit [Chromobacterium alkanivorans]|uniref:restriction endonuclease subunit S n=1 Tax=Chromobacterium alkanivorans TaxID=1071719 RepID=UPI002169C35D|nr:restriction endonuclease subunit S [Chromobacterium alkanivorans]MCS3803497.1 type I restriction enzyme S subunit [Chromobacterium alkanivorans]MCS3817393.1 type I restriction enzyme S subunit [Chromobacterium alkanivorans]MCS3872863.1 type I restriction enzyme S subunit [Chromobacterium alkanivorans]
MSLPRYPQYKDSGATWLGEVPANWETRRVKFLFEIKKRIAGEEGYDVLSITQQGIKVKDIESNDGQLSMDYAKYQFVEIGDFAMNHMDLLTGYVDISQYFGVTSPDYRVFSVRDDTVCNARYFLYLFQNGYRKKIFYAFGQGASQFGRWRFPTEQFNDFIFPLPPRSEQTAITNFLDRETGKIDALIAEQEKLLTLLTEKRQATISHAVTKGLNPNAPMKDSGVAWLGEVPVHWDVMRLKYICDVQTGDKDTVEAVDDGDYPFFVRSQTVERINTFTFDCEAVLTAGDGAGVGKVFHYFNGKFDFHQRVYMMNNFRFAKGEFFFRYISSMFYKVALEGGAKSTVDSLRMPLFMNFHVTAPPIKEQSSIIAFLDRETAKLDALTAEATRAIELLKERRTALISAAVTGQIDVRGVVIQPGQEVVAA